MSDPAVAVSMDLTPWVAAVWVDPPFRGLSIGGDVVLKAAQAALDTGTEAVHLCVLSGKRAFYERLGWQLDEKDVGEDRLNVFSRRRT